MDRTVRWRLCDAKDLCGAVFPTLRGLKRSGEEREMMTGRVLAGSTRSTRATPSSLLTGTDVGRKMAGGYIVRKCSTDEVTTKVEV